MQSASTIPPTFASKSSDWPVEFRRPCEFCRPYFRTLCHRDSTATHYPIETPDSLSPPSLCGLDFSYSFPYASRAPALTHSSQSISIALVPNLVRRSSTAYPTKSLAATSDARTSYVQSLLFSFTADTFRFEYYFYPSILISLRSLSTHSTITLLRPICNQLIFCDTHAIPIAHAHAHTHADARKQRIPSALEQSMTFDVNPIY